MTIGILTYHRAHNYGAMLQAYALRTFLQDSGYVVNFIDYWPQYHNQQYALIRPILGDTLKNRCINLFSDILTLRRRYKRRKRFENFRERYLGLSCIAQYTLKESTLHDTYDCVIVGSDQIWRNRHTGGKYLGWDRTYFCQTISTRHCISYAASMGVISLDDTERIQLTQYLKRFDTLLVREQSLCNLIKDCGYSAEVVLDPTLLFAKEKWNRILPQTSYRRYAYVLYYELLPNAQGLKYATEKAKELRCKLLVMDGNIHTIPRLGHIQYASPIEFMHAVRDAEFVVATSFHGTAFSIIFEKQFITIGLKDNADRVLTLLQALDIEEHYITSFQRSISMINYTNIEKKMAGLRTNSQKLLLNAINEI